MPNPLLKPYKGHCPLLYYMTNYQVDLFEDVGFTADYSNILDFDNAESREAYFDGLSHVSLSGTSVFKDFQNGGTIRVSAPTWYDRVSYARIKSVKFADGLQYTTYVYCFVISYEVISSNENVTIVEYTIRNDLWMNNQFNIELKPCNIDRMHVDRWETDGSVAWGKPSSDGVSANMAIGNYNYAEYKHHATVWCVHFDSDTTDFKDAQYVKKEVDIVWVLVVAIHTYGELDDQMQFHVFPIKISDLEYNCSNDSNITYFTQNAICAHMDSHTVQEPFKLKSAKYDSSIKTIQNYNGQLVFPSIDCLDSAQLPKSLKLTDDDVVQIVNIMPLKYLFLDDGVENVNYTSEYYSDSYINYFPQCDGMRWQTATLDTRIATIYTHSIFQIPVVQHGIQVYSNLKITKPTDGVKHSDKYEPMMVRNPVRRFYVTNGDATAITEVPDIYLTSGWFNLNASCDVNPTQCSDIMNITGSRALSNVLGFQFISPSLQIDFMNDSWYQYCVTQRDSDRAMAVANILAGTVSDTGSTYVSSGIGYRSNMTQAECRRLEMETENVRRRGYEYGSQKWQESWALNNELSRKANLASGMAGMASKASLVGGVTAIAGQAIGSAVGQWARETTVKNAPATLASAGNFASKVLGKWYKVIVVETVADSDSYALYDEIYSKYGYYIGTVGIPNFRTRKFFNYLKTNGAIVTGSASQTVLLNIASIFDNGVTIWHMDNNTRETLYNYEYENIERSLI